MLELRENRENDDDINRSRSPLSVVSKSEIAQKQIAKAISGRKRHFVVIQVICRLCKDIIYHCTIVRQRGVRCDVSIVSPRLARAYNPRQHFCEIIGNVRKLLNLFTIKVIKSTTQTSLVNIFSFVNSSETSQCSEREQSERRRRKLFLLRENWKTFRLI